MRDELFEEVGAELHFADAGFRLGVGNSQPGSVRVVESDLREQYVAQLARAQAGAPERRDDGAPP